MNYRHAFHAGNFADLVKHAVLLDILAELMRDARPLTVMDTHGGAGRYDLSDVHQQRSREAEAGVQRLMQAEPGAAFQPLAEAVRRLNPDGGLRFYPGSPWLTVDAMRPGDRYVACELRPDDHGQLETTLKRLAEPKRVKAEARRADGYATAREVAREAGRLFVLIDPPFEKSDDYDRAADTAAAIVKAKSPPPCVAIWTPLKDLETFDGFLRRLRSGGAEKVLVAEARLRPLHDPMKMNGCAMVVVNPPVALRDRAQAVCEEVVRTLGDPGGLAKVWKL